MPVDFPDLNRAIEAFEKKQQNLAEFEKKLDESSTSVDSAKRMLTVTTNGHGEISDLKFNNTAYRSMPPAELASVLLETLQSARTKSLNQMRELMGDDIVPGLDIGELNSGKADLGAVLGTLAEPALNTIRDADAVLHNRPRGLRRAAENAHDDGWEHR